MKKLSVAAILMMLMWSLNANAWFFFFFPTSIFSGSGDTCIATDKKVGDTLPSPIGKDNTAEIKAISGTSSRCKGPNTILATVQFHMNTNSKASIDIPDEYQPRKLPLTDLERFHGILLSAVNKNTSNKGFTVFYRTRDISIAPEIYTQAVASSLMNVLKDAQTSNEEELTINGMRAWRFEVSGKVGAVFGSRVTYQITMLEGDKEYIMVNAYTTENKYEAEKEELGLLSSRITNIKNDANTQNVKSNDQSNRSESISKSGNNLTQDLKSTVDSAKSKCTALGFEEKTEKFGNCVLEIIK